ncbi:AraC family transcriptional regulator [Chitinophaga sp. 212800010-3]|uniref:helix-turn-helix domain-containing protein n=1 Tax=unclassified Chitinophaga TaxID=2619133 RepID=UPI002DEE5678|nr:HTH araC/xylS-type domain-containing protein [Chitinophaga sp. 212800010-3]
MYATTLEKYGILAETGHTKGMKEQYYTMKPEDGWAGNGSYTSLDGIDVHYSQVSALQTMRVDLVSPDDFVEMHFSLSGRLAAKSPVLRHLSTFDQLQHNLFAVPANSITNYDYQVSNEPVAMLEILFRKEYFESIMHEQSALHNTVLDHIARKKMMAADQRHAGITPQMLSVLSDIIYCKRTGYYKKIFLEARIMELFLLQTEVLEERSGRSGCNFLSDFSADVDKIYFVKEMIDKDPIADYSLIGLSKKAGLNTFKLKKGFKEVFGETVFGYIQDLKMEKARRMLLDEGMQVSEVAYVLGYNSPNNFSTAFRKKFGLTPGKMKQ